MLVLKSGNKNTIPDGENHQFLMIKPCKPTISQAGELPVRFLQSKVFTGCRQRMSTPQARAAAVTQKTTEETKGGAAGSMNRKWIITYRTVFKRMYIRERN